MTNKITVFSNGEVYYYYNNAIYILDNSGKHFDPSSDCDVIGVDCTYVDGEPDYIAICDWARARNIQVKEWLENYVNDIMGLDVRTYQEVYGGPIGLKTYTTSQECQGRWVNTSKYPTLRSAEYEVLLQRRVAEKMCEPQEIDEVCLYNGYGMDATPVRFL